MTSPGLTPKLTVAMSVYNNAPYLAEAMDSILRQSFTDFEFLIVNDGSTDGSGAVIDAYALRDPRIRVIHQDNRGLVVSLNRLFAEASAAWVARMDGDDVALPERLAAQWDFVSANPGHGVVGTFSYLIGPDSQPLGKSGGHKPVTHDDLCAHLEDGPLFVHASVMIAREAMLGVDGYHPAYKHCEDHDLWLRLAEHTRLANLPEELLAYRVYPEQVSHRHLVEQAANAAISWQARLERVAGRPDPTAGLDEMPPLSELDALFGRTGVAAYVRAKVVNRMLFAPDALSGEGFGILLDYIGEAGAEPRTWRAAARILRSGHPAKAAAVAHALLKAS